MNAASSIGAGPVAGAPNLSLAWAAALIEELCRAGLRHAVVSPGSRSAPLALACATRPDLADHPVLDERTAAFFALGLARGRGGPVALVCTSGTAAANYLPAVVEAHYAAVPLLLLTADRPPELRECSAGQTIDQNGLYDPFTRFSADVSAPRTDDHAFRNLRALACRAMALAGGPHPGPVHLNLPFREPLSPVPVPSEQSALAERSPLATGGRVGVPFTAVSEALAPSPSPEVVRSLAAAMRAEPRGWIVAGPGDSAAAGPIADLAQQAGWPLLAEPLSHLRCGDFDRRPAVACNDAVLRCTLFARSARPRCVLRFGAPPTARIHRDFLEAHPEIRQIVVDPHGWADPGAHAEQIVRSDAAALARALRDALPIAPSPDHDRYREAWMRAGRTAEAAIDRALASAPKLHEPIVVRTLAKTVPAGTALYVGSSMPVRDVDSYWPASERPIHFFGNRGANGIDGSVSTALGVSVAAGCGVALLGDLAVLHDVSGLLLARSAEANATLVVVDNGGGGIFELLPIADAVDRVVFERHFATPPAADLGAVVRGFGLPLEEVDDAGSLADAVTRSIEAGGTRVIRARVDRHGSRALRTALQRSVDDALTAEDLHG